ncbi:RadC family protein [Allomuricauda sp. ARW1Y1]|jgi:DNA repair protein RadC|uniref:JAB domain-containing protein n=1 Tax=Allomuricauda sp. ARW1Y1 TaxID=2663843 RepID=UPI0015CADCFC|nr:JAB domain-containing protein [Muricauda sp. ARW1Y1]NYJ28233.1 DNA repair protein RadC [Muricauda sp. ARW1Y1]
MQLQANEIKVSYQGKIQAKYWHKINSSEDAAQLLSAHWDQDTISLHESFKVVLLNNGNKVKGIYEVSKGGITGTLVDLRILFAVILKTVSVGIILAHNHPSSTLKPSEADLKLTKKIKDAAKFFDVQVLDHIILTPDGGYYSFADNGVL